MNENVQKIVDEGQALAKAGRMEDAVIHFTKALTEAPKEGLFYRYRGHRYISSDRYWEGAADLKLAAALIPDNWDVWYHLGLAFYLLGDDVRALDAYKTCYDMSEVPELLIPITDWIYLTLLNLGEQKQADEVAARITKDMDPGENIAYMKRVLVYNGSISPEDALSWYEQADEPINKLTFAYGFSRYLETHGRDELAARIKKDLEALSTDTTLRYGFAALAYKARKA